MMAVDMLNGIHTEQENAHVHICHSFGHESLLVKQLVRGVERGAEEQSEGLSTEDDV